MRLWSIHPKYLDSKGLVALWREGLLAQKVLEGKTKGYRNHPQLERFKKHPNPNGSLAEYLRCVYDEATERNYKFDKAKIANRMTKKQIFVTNGQVNFEFAHLLNKLEIRAPEQYKLIKNIKEPSVNPILKVIGGEIEPWEII